MGEVGEVGMIAKHVIPGVVLLTLAGVSAAIAQTPSPTYAPSATNAYLQPPSAPGSSPYGQLPAPLAPALPPSMPSAAIVNPVEPVSPSAIAWQQSSPAYCCGPFGANGPIGAEIFLYTGPTIPSSGGTLYQQIHTGWMAEWGGRSLFFNTARDAAWTAKLSVTFAYNGGVRRAGPTFDYFGLPVRVRDLERWSFTFGGGRDWFLLGSRDSGSSNLRFGLETGGRWGTEHVDLLLDIFDPLHQSDYLRRQDIFGAFYLGAHIDYEIPMGSWVWIGGFRAEHNWNFNDVLVGNSSTLRDVNLLLSTGIRY